MGIASVILGVLGILLSWISCLWPIVVIHVVFGLGLGVGDVVMKLNANSRTPLDEDQIRQSRISVGVAGICLNVAAAVLTLTWYLFWGTKGFGTFQ
ncbi:MAG: hypothetical protein HON53_16345 [Planctomycetaceae bacterium]|jgi:hypothetical protein|nr:hypothetical protein [Planctomycetaceae bacterium]MBT6153660.1 hypothetical protein [Planctomycetaceae bacterium]MBT6484289.1 hypothetical protein [Planctomycetaceae bacterium]MBT6496681.1 hypothetical protein [Planctomycetaceae bacterium]